MTDTTKIDNTMAALHRQLVEQIRALTSKLIHRDDKIAALEPSLNAALMESADLKQQLDVALAERDRFDSDLEQCKESRQELERTSVSLNTYKLLEARLEESHETIKLLAESLRGDQ